MTDQRWIGTAEKEEEELARMSLFDHLDELRSRLVWSVGILLVGFIVCFSFAKQIFAVVQRPIEPHLDSPLTFLGPADAFMMFLKVSLLAAIFLMSPFLVWQLWRFVSPGLYKKERRYALPFIFFGSGFFVAGGLFAYYVALPFALEFLINFGGDQLQADITAERYMSFVIPIVLGLGIMFELPILIFMLSQLGVVTPKFLMRHFRWAVLIIFFISALITPTPDPWNLMVVALPTLALYLLGVGAAALAGPRKRVPDEDEPGDSD